MKYKGSFKKTLCAMIIALVFAPAPLYGNATFDQAVGYSAAKWIMDKILGAQDNKPIENVTCMVLSDETNSIPLQALMTARHMTLVAVNHEPRSKEIVGRLNGAVKINNLFFMDYSRTLGRYWPLMKEQYDKLNDLYDNTAVSDMGLNRLQYLDLVTVMIERPSKKEIKITYTFPTELKIKDCCTRNTKSVSLSVSTKDYGAFAPNPK